MDDMTKVLHRAGRVCACRDSMSLAYVHLMLERL